MNLGTTTGPLRCHHSLAQHVADNPEMGKSGLILKNEVTGGALKLNDLPTSLHRHSAIHSEDLARDVTSLWSGQK